MDKPDEIIVWELGHLKKVSGIVQVGENAPKVIPIDGENYEVSSIRVNMSLDQLQMLLNLANFMTQIKESKK